MHVNAFWWQYLRLQSRCALVYRGRKFLMWSECSMLFLGEFSCLSNSLRNVAINRDATTSSLIWQVRPAAIVIFGLGSGHLFAVNLWSYGNVLNAQNHFEFLKPNIEACLKTHDELKMVRLVEQRTFLLLFYFKTSTTNFKKRYISLRKTTYHNHFRRSPSVRRKNKQQNLTAFNLLHLHREEVFATIIIARSERHMLFPKFEKWAE